MLSTAMEELNLVEMRINSKPSAKREVKYCESESWTVSHWLDTTALPLDHREGPDEVRRTRRVPSPPSAMKYEKVMPHE